MQIPFELEALSNAKEYQKWMFQTVEPYLGKSIFELGSGIGNMSQWLPVRDKLVLSDVEHDFVNILKNYSKFKAPNIEILNLDLSQSLNAQVEKYQVDTIISFNVLEHIENDLMAVREQVEVLKASKANGVKRLILVVPANQFAYGSLDKIFKHYRRYSKKMMLEIFVKIDPALKPNIRYFNLLSLPGWFIQGRILKASTIKPNQVKILEKVIPFWKGIDHFLIQTMRIALGQSLVCVVEIPSASK
jgi:phospholipid N-methyltransferase